MSTTIEKSNARLLKTRSLLYMKGSPKLPSCGFSARGSPVRLPHVANVLPMLIFCRIRTFVRNCRNMRNWPTFPQLWVDGELVGGCDIVIEMYQRGELQQLIKETAAKYKSEEPDAE